MLRSVFPSNQLSKGTPLVVYSQPSKDDTTRSLVFEGLGEVDNTWVSKEFFMAYFVGEGNSPAVGRLLDNTRLTRGADNALSSSYKASRKLWETHHFSERKIRLFNTKS